MKPPSRKSLAKNSSRSCPRRAANGSAANGSGMAGLAALRIEAHCTRHAAAVAPAAGSGVLLLFHAVGNHAQQPAGFVEVEIVAVLHAKDALAAPALAPQFFGRVYDDPQEGFAADQFGNQLLRGREIQGGAVHSVSPGTAVRATPTRRAGEACGRGGV